MKISSKVTKLRNFVVSHQSEIILAVVAFGVGVTATTLYQENDLKHTVKFATDKKTLKKMTEEGGCILFESYRDHDYALINYPG
jgi:hypothetical protein